MRSLDSPARNRFGICTVSSSVVKDRVFRTGTQPRLTTLKAGEELLAVVWIGKAVVIAEAQHPGVDQGGSVYVQHGHHEYSMKDWGANVRHVPSTPMREHTYDSS